MLKFPTTAEDRLERLGSSLSGTRVQSRAGQRKQMNRSGNLLAGVLFHAAARLDKGLPLTDLEQDLIDSVAKLVPPKELPGFGRVYRDACARGPIATLPQAITSRPLEDGYSNGDLKAAMPELAAEISAQPNVQIIDVSKHADTDSFDSEEFTAAMGEYGRGITVLTGPTPAADTQGLLNVRLRMNRFHCLRESGESGRDEIFWAVSAGSDTTAKKSFVTREYGATSSGDWHTFDYDFNNRQTYLFDGTVDQHISTEIECWEADDSSGGFYNSLRDALGWFSDRAADTSIEMTRSGGQQKAAAWSALAALGAGLLDEILGWFTNDDDLVCSRLINLDRAALYSLRDRPGNEDYWNFNGGGGGHHRLYLISNDFA